MPRGWGTKYQYESPPRKAMSAYSFYVQDFYRYWRRILRTRNPHRVIREVAKQWKNLDREQRSKYFRLAEQDKERAKKERMEFYALIDSGQIPPPPLHIRITKQDGYPRSTKNAYVFFSNEVRNTIRKEHPEYTYLEVMREIGTRWRKMDHASKKKYVDLRNRDKARYNAAKSDYRRLQKEAKRKKRLEEARARLNRLFNQKVPSAFTVGVNFKAEEATGNAAAVKTG